MFVAVLLLVGVAGVGVLGVQMNMGMELYLEDDSDTVQNWDELQDDFNTGNVVFAVVETDNETDIFDPEVMRSVDELTQQYSTNVDAAATVTSYTQLLAQNGGLPETRNEAVAGLSAVESSSEQNAQILDNLVPTYGESNDTAIVQLQYGSAEVPDNESDLFGFMPPSEGEVVKDQINAATDAVTLPDGATVTITGGPIFQEAAFGLMLPEMITLFALAFTVILVTMTLVMRGRLRKTRRVVIPLATTLVALLTMVGMMGVVGFNFNAIMLGVLPVALGLGIDYGLQIQTRYVEERENGRGTVDAAGIAARTAGRSLTLALGTTLVGLGSLLAASVPPVRQFGVTAAFSVLMSMVLSLTLLIALLTTFDDGDATTDEDTNRSEKTDSTGSVERAAGALGDVITARPLAVVLVFALVIAGGLAAYPMVQTQDNMFDYWPDIEEKDDLEDLESTVGSPNVLYVVVDGDDIYNDQGQLEAVSEFESEIGQTDHVVTSLSPVSAVETRTERQTGVRSIPDNATVREAQFDALQRTDVPPVGAQPFDETPDRLLVQLYVEELNGSEEEEVIATTAETANATLGTMDARVSGNIVINRNVIENVTAGLTATTLLSFGAGLVFLGLALRSGRESAVLVGAVAASTMALVAGGMFLIGVPWNPLTVTTASIVFGVGITYGIHVYERFREELAVTGVSPDEAIRAAIVAKARPVMGSGATTMFGFGVLIVSDFPVLSNFGLAIALAMGLALLSAFVFMPAVVLLLSRVSVLPAGATGGATDPVPEQDAPVPDDD
ncbi:MAG: putative exporters of the RND superfamily [halophilic archaeon J07HX64]|nr:MAG: putative exporters of the RND superfamily [halophilic archaeon J07HX64]